MMKRILLVMVMMLLVSIAVSAQLPPRGYVGLYADVDRATWCVYGDGMIPIYLIVWPSDSGLDTVELQTVPTNPLIGFMFPVWHPSVALAMGTIPGDLVVSFNECQLDWTIVLSITMVVMDEDPHTIFIEAHSLSPDDYPVIVDCAQTKDEATVYTHLYLNITPCPELASYESTWGAIKNMYE